MEVFAPFLKNQAKFIAWNSVRIYKGSFKCSRTFINDFVTKCYKIFQNAACVGFCWLEVLLIRKYLLPSGPSVPQKVFGSRNWSWLTYVPERSSRHRNPLKHMSTFTQLRVESGRIQSHPEPHCGLQEADVILRWLCGLNGIDYLKILDMALLAFSRCIKHSHPWN